MPNSDVPAGPVAKKIPLEMTEHGDTRVDDYFWMRLSDEQKNAEMPDAQTQDVLDYLDEENKYIDKALAHTEGLQNKLFDEIVGRIKKDDRSVPVKEDTGITPVTRMARSTPSIVASLRVRRRSTRNVPALRRS